MKIRNALILVATLFLSGCSYTYDVIAVVRSGRLYFEVGPRSGREPECLRNIEIDEAESGREVWSQSVDYEDDCDNKFPFEYGAPFKGAREAQWPWVQAQKLRQDVVYVVTTTTGATGYGSGQFVLRRDGTVKNLSFGKGQE